MFKLMAKWVPKSLKIGVWRADFGGPGGILGILGGLCRKVVPKRRPKCSQDGPRCSQRGQLERTWGPSWRQDGGMMANLPPRWHQKAIKKRIGIERFFRQVFGCVLRRFWEPKLKKNRYQNDHKIDQNLS